MVLISVSRCSEAEFQCSACPTERPDFKKEAERERGLAEKYGFNDDDVVTYKTRLFQYSLAVLRMQLRLPSPYQVGYIIRTCFLGDRVNGSVRVGNNKSGPGYE